MPTEVWFRTKNGYVRARTYVHASGALRHIQRICRALPSLSLQDFKLKEHK